VAADALVVCTPTKTHAALCRAGFRAGKHVLVEKGMTLDWAEARALVREGAAAGVCFCVSQNYRYMAETRTLRALLDQGTYGVPHLIDLIHHRYRPEPRTLDYPFAMIWDMACHHFDNLVSLFGPVARATAVSHNAPWSAYAHDAGVSAVLEFRAGAVCTYLLTHQARYGEYRLVVQTERGALRWDQAGRRWQFLPHPDRQLGPNPPPVLLETVAAGRSEQGVVDDWYRYIAAGVEPGISGRRNLQTLAACEMVVRAARASRPVTAEELAA
jgi:predicted dehydrogenase